LLGLFCLEISFDCKSILLSLASRKRIDLVISSIVPRPVLATIYAILYYRTYLSVKDLLVSYLPSVNLDIT